VIAAPVPPDTVDAGMSPPNTEEVLRDRVAEHLPRRVESQPAQIVLRAVEDSCTSLMIVVMSEAAAVS